jgi:putative oxidoreductase
MNTYLGKYSEYAFALMRIVVGLLFAAHGAQKLFGVLGGTKVPLFSLYGAAGVIEFFGGLLIALGLLGSWAAFVASGQMAVAYFMAHFPKAFWPIENGGVPAALYCIAFLYIAIRGSGVWSVDAALARK